MRNLCIIFNKVHKLRIDPCNITTKDWIDKVVGIELGQIIRNLQLLHPAGIKNLLLLKHHHNHVIEYPPPSLIEARQLLFIGTVV